MKRYLQFFVILGIFIVFSCQEKDKTEVAINALPINLEVVRFDDEFANAKPEAIPILKNSFPYLFPEQVPDSVWIMKLTDTLQLELKAEIDKAFPNFKTQEKELITLFKHIKYYVPNYEVPKVVTLVSEVQYDARVVLTDSLLLIGLDNYLGPEHKFYAGLSNYIAKALNKDYMMADVAGAFAKTINKFPRNRTFLSRMVYYGKELWIKDKLLPKATDAEKIGFTPEEMAWAKANEEQMWRYFVEQELLYSTASELDRRFLDPAPFSKFRLELDNETPGRLGRYMGWQIVRAYAKNNPKVSLMELLDMPSDELFKKSNYKPKK
ncbi:gliding motility lipoprotein GldB [Croceivirga sp. JEA036]|uniref:gliding motility lipoprotein GldB n=1 Tax=Croceivirga sp. JEA036 TaxID=2721162 RepID=UPI00143A06A5|nr:gliding motility lipoprotein GldB [Croceivirga sp. JEA036]NJB36093.1 gliding motility lipoprotein GldB [Croceivirga sp. JEA036]